MKNSPTLLATRLLILVISIFLSGCDFDEPIVSNPTSKIDSRLIGTWKLKDDSDAIFVELKREDDGHCVGRSWSESEPNKISQLHTWPSLIGETLFLTVDLGKEESKRYLYAQIQFKDKNTVQYRQVNSDSSFAKDLNGPVLARLTRHLKDQDLLRDEKIFNKISSN